MMKYPQDKSFIFTIFDDTDVATLDYIRPIYDALYKYGLLTTKSVWPLDYENDSHYAGSHSLQNASYADYIKKLSERGFEIAFHGPRMESSERELIVKAFEEFKRILGFYPRNYAPHSSNRENLYWGEHRFTNTFLKFLFRKISRTDEHYYQGHDKKSTFFWGDIATDYLDYVRNFTFDEINLNRINAPNPYISPLQPYAPSIYYTCDADNVVEFNALLRKDNLKKLEKEGGVCILSTHFGKGFLVDGQLHKKTESIFQTLSQMNGWYRPVSEVLDFLRSQGRNQPIEKSKLRKLEWAWFFHSLFRKIKRKSYTPTEIPYLEQAKLQKGKNG